MNAPRIIREVSRSEVEGRQFIVVKKSRHNLHENGNVIPGRYILDGIRRDIAMTLQGMTPTEKEAITGAHTHIITSPVESIQPRIGGGFGVYTRDCLYELSPVETEKAA